MTSTVLDIHVARTPGNFVQSRFTFITACVFLTYVALAIFLPQSWLVEVMRCFQITFSFVVLMGYWKHATICFYIVGRWPEKQNVIALGILISWFSIFINSIWGLLWRLAGQPAWMVNNDYYTAWTACSTYAAALHIIAPNMIGAGIPVMDKRRYVAVGVIGGALALLVGVWRPDLSVIAEQLRETLHEPDWAREGLIRLLTGSRTVASYLGLG